MDSLDNLANNIASATFDVINAGKVRTADMGGKFQSPIPKLAYLELIIFDPRLCNHL